MAIDRNGELSALVNTAGFEVFVTVDRNLSYQQNLPNVPLRIVVLRARTNRLADLRALIPALNEAIAADGIGLVTIEAS